MEGYLQRPYPTNGRLSVATRFMCKSVAGAKMDKGTRTGLLWSGALAVVIAVVGASSIPWWGKYVGWGSVDSVPQSAVAGMSGGCTPFEAIAQNRYPPYGAAIRTQPNALSTQVGSYVGNKPISVNGWVYGTAEYPTNPPPWNSNIWFHLSDGSGWVSFPGVRAYPTTPDPDGLNPNGGPPVATPSSCEGAIQ
jgi:hypothetical protein